MHTECYKDHVICFLYKGTHTKCRPSTYWHQLKLFSTAGIGLTPIIVILYTKYWSDTSYSVFFGFFYSWGDCHVKNWQPNILKRDEFFFYLCPDLKSSLLTLFEFIFVTTLFGPDSHTMWTSEQFPFMPFHSVKWKKNGSMNKPCWKGKVVSIFPSAYQ